LIYIIGNVICSGKRRMTGIVGDIMTPYWIGPVINLMSAKVAVTMGFALPWVADPKLLFSLPSHPFSFNSERKWGKRTPAGDKPPAPPRP
jgi:hypothetical protein